MLAKRTEQVDKHQIKVNEQVRRHFDKADLLRLAESMFAEQLQPIGLTPDYTLCWGERRWRAAMLLDKITHLWAVILDKPMTESEFRVLQLTENLLREDLKAAEKTRGIAELKRLNPTWTNNDVAAHLKIAPSTVTKLVCVYDCIPEVQQAYFAGQINGVVYGISKLPADQQLEVLAMALAGATRDQIERHGRKVMKANGQVVKVSRIKIALASGVAVTLSADALTLDAAIEAAAETHRVLEKGRKDGLTAKTIQKVSADRAAKGGG